MSESKTHEHGEISTRLFTCAEGHKCSHEMKEDPPPPHLSLTQAVHLSPSHWSGQGTQSSRWANLKQIITGGREEKEGVEEGVLDKAGMKWSNQDFL